MVKKVFKKTDELICDFVSIFFHSEMRQETARQFIKFAMIGVVNTVIDFGIYFVLTRYVPFFSARKSMIYFVNCISFLSGTTFSFFANRNWTFGMTSKATIDEAKKFYTTTLSGLAINSLILYIVASLFGVNDLISKVFSTIFSTIWNFTLKKLWVFA